MKIMISFISQLLSNEMELDEIQKQVLEHGQI